MGKKLFLLGCLFICSNLVFGDNLICSIDKEINKETAKTLQKIRSQTHSICLNCSGDACTMKPWPSEKLGDEQVCKVVFCTPLRVSRVFKKPEDAKSGKSLINFDYYISAQGRIKGVDITSVKGSLNERQAYKYVTSFSKKTIFLPLRIEDKQFQILGLSGQVVALIGSPEDINKYREANTGLWRN